MAALELTKIPLESSIVKTFPNVGRVTHLESGEPPHGEVFLNDNLRKLGTVNRLLYPLYATSSVLALKHDQSLTVVGDPLGPF